MRTITDIVIHCTATREGQHITVEDVRKWHKNKGWSDIGYHYLIYLDGTVAEGRPLHIQGAHVRGYNRKSIGISYVGGVDKDLKPKDTRTDAQKESLICLLHELTLKFQDAKISGHRDFSKDVNNNGIIEPFEFMKACPCFDAEIEYKNI